MPPKCHSFLPLKRLTHSRHPSFGFIQVKPWKTSNQQVRHELGDSSHPWLGALWLDNGPKNMEDPKNRFGRKKHMRIENMSWNNCALNFLDDMLLIKPIDISLVDKELRHRFGRSTICIHGAFGYSSTLELTKLLVAGAFGWRTSIKCLLHRHKWNVTVPLQKTKSQEFEPNKDKKYERSLVEVWHPIFHWIMLGLKIP